MMTAMAPVASMPVTAAELAAAIAAAECSNRAVTLIGHGGIGQHYLSALRALGIRRIRVCSRSADSVSTLRATDGVEIVTGGFAALGPPSQPEELAVIATPIGSLLAAAQHLASRGFRHLLIEKPVALQSSGIERLAEALRRDGVEAAVAYNRVAYPSFHEVAARAAREGGITSCTYTFTERVQPDWPQRFSQDILARWGIANSLHVMSMAHGLIGMPASWAGRRSGALPWHPAGAVFVGCGVSARAIPFAYHADWGSTERWSVTVHTRLASYRLCPLEQVFRRASAAAEWEEMPIAAFAAGLKAGFAEQLAAALSAEIRPLVPAVSLEEAAALTRYAEGVFGYAA